MKTTEEKRDYRQEVTSDIIRLLEEGTAPWQKPWESGSRLPVNAVTGASYRGGNVIWLMIAGMRQGFSDPRWMTYRQAEAKGWQVRRGSKGIQIEFWEMGRRRRDDGESDADTNRRGGGMIHRVYTVFNASQCEGCPAIEIAPRQPFEVIAAGEEILAHTGADIRFGGDRAFYNKRGDYIQLPNREDFVDAPAFYGVACHELAHWTGHAARLNRASLTQSSQHGDELYAQDELICDIASCMVAAEKGIPYNVAQTAAYVASWIKALKDNKNAIFQAASQASKATDYILGTAPKEAEAVAA